LNPFSLELIDDQGKDLGKFFFIKNKPNFQNHEKILVNFDPNEANRYDIDVMIGAFIEGKYRKIPKVELFYDSCEILIDNLYKKVDLAIEHDMLETIPGLTLEETKQRIKYQIRTSITGPRDRIREKIEDLINFYHRQNPKCVI